MINRAVLGVAQLARMHPDLRALSRSVEVIRDVPYLKGAGPEHCLDVYRPRERTGRMPTLLYVHGGGFRLLSKDTHWIMAAILARSGYLVFTTNYRLAPAHPFPAAVEDVCRAALWIQAEASAWGGDGLGLSLAGESAGANLVTALTIAACYQRPEPYARAVFDAELAVRSVLPACGLHQVTDMERFARANPKLWPVIRRRMQLISHDYLGGARLDTGGESLANPLLILETGERPARSLPAFMLTCGDRDPILADTQRMHVAVQSLGARVETRIYSGGHAFHAAIWLEEAQRCWRDQLRFVSTEHPAEPV